MSHIVSALKESKYFQNDFDSHCDEEWRDLQLSFVKESLQNHTLIDDASEAFVSNLLSVHDKGSVDEKKTIDEWFRLWFRRIAQTAQE